MTSTSAVVASTWVRPLDSMSSVSARELKKTTMILKRILLGSGVHNAYMVT